MKTHDIHFGDCIEGMSRRLEADSVDLYRRNNPAQTPEGQRPGGCL